MLVVLSLLIGCGGSGCRGGGGDSRGGYLLAVPTLERERRIIIVQ